MTRWKEPVNKLQLPFHTNESDHEACQTIRAEVHGTCYNLHNWPDTFANFGILALALLLSSQINHYICSRLNKSKYGRRQKLSERKFTWFSQIFDEL